MENTKENTVNPKEVQCNRKVPQMEKKEAEESES